MAFWGNVGDTVQFKNSSRKHVEWEVAFIETDYEKCKWSKGGKTPNFIKLQRKVKAAGDKMLIDVCWTNPQQLKAKGSP